MKQLPEGTIKEVCNECNEGVFAVEALMRRDPLKWISLQILIK